MNKTILALGGLSILAVGGYFLFSANDPQPSLSQSLEEAAEEAAAPESTDGGVLEEGLGSLKALIARGENLTCEFRHATDDGMVSTGQVYISGDNFRVDSRTTDTAQGTFVSSMIFKDEVFHAWSTSPAGETFGLTFAATQNDVIENSQESGVTDGSVSLDQEVDFTCQAWNGDEAMFVPPSDIEFFDPSAMFLPQ